LDFSQLDQKGLKDELAKKEVTLRMLEDELAARGETIDRLTQSFSRQHSDGSTQEDAIHLTEPTSAIPSHRKSINAIDNVIMKLDEGIPEYLRHKNAPQDEEHIAGKAFATLSPTEVVTPITAHSLSTSSKFDSLKQRYLKKVRNK
jgi:hypothetical protein